METALDQPIESLMAAPEAAAIALSQAYSLTDVIDFSGAAGVWEEADRTGRRPTQHTPLDQSLFRGSGRACQRYFAGISAIAQRNAPMIVAGLAQQGAHFPRLLDFGAGRGDYAAALLRGGITADVTCVDVPQVARSRKRLQEPHIHWLVGDVRDPKISRSRFDAIWVSNVLHHYGQSEVMDILRHSMKLLAPRGTLLIQEYMLDAAGTQALAAGILGLHFALTTNGGKCYSTGEIQALCRRAGDYWVPSFRIPLPISTVLAFRRASGNG